MFKKRLQKQSNNHGFTTIEVVMVVAVLAILLALVAPSVAQSWKRLKIAELDGAAREIFLTAQNELTDAKASGALEELMADTSPVKTESVTEPVIKTLYYITSDSMNGSMPELSVLMATLPGEFVLYLNPRTGDVTDVYYAKNTLSHSEVVALRNQLGDTDDRDLRGNLGIGYYGGLSKYSGEVSETEEPPLPETLEIINSEDLYLKVAYPRLVPLGKVAESGKILAEITLKDEHGKTLVLKANGDSAADPQTPDKAIFANLIANNDYILHVLLDSMVPGYSFTELCRSLTAGDDITVSVSLFYDGKPIYTDAPVGMVNSLFAAKYEADTTAGGISHKKGVEFSNSRHLSNLSYYSGVAGGPGTAAQMKDIDFTLEKRKGNMLDNELHRVSAPKSFRPIELDNLMQNGITVDGMGGNAKTPYLLENFIITENGYGGLFGNCSVGASFKNLRLVDPQVSGRGYIGGLIGYANSRNGRITIENCGVYRTPLKSTDTHAGIGFINGKNTFIDQPTGGLIGGLHAEGVYDILIDKSFAAIPVSNERKQTGGLIGNISGSGQVTIQNSYASGKVTSEGEDAYKEAVGGLVGAVGYVGYSGLKVDIVNSFSSSDVFGLNLCGGLVGDRIGNATINVNNSYACGIVTKGTVATYGPLVGNGTATYINSRYLSQSGNTAVSNGYATTVAGITALEYDDLAKVGGSPIVNNPAKCHPYNPLLLEKAYPFTMATAEYYGDWPARIEPQVPQEGIPHGLCYYEEYTDGTWGFYGYEIDPVTGVRKMADTLDYTNNKAIKEASYGVLVSNTTPPSDVHAPSFTWQPPGQRVPLNPKVDLIAYGKHLYPLKDPKALINHDNQLDFEIIDNQTQKLFYINTYFGAAISTERLFGARDKQIRTEEHLRNQKYIEYTSFWVSHDITVTLADTGNLYNNGAANTFDGKNDVTGGNNTIYGLKRHLFRLNEGTIKNLNLANVQINSTGNTAAFVLSNNGTRIENCHVLSGSITSTGGRVAGFADYNGGTIENSSVAKVVTVSGNNKVAGFISENHNNSIIGNCSSAAIVTAGAQGGAGFAYTNNGNITNAYATGSVTAQSGGAAYGFVHTMNSGTIENAYRIGTTTAAGNAAGFCGSLSNGTIRKSVSSGRVTSQNGHASGFVYTITNNRIESSYRIGITEASGNASGFVSEIVRGSIENCFVAGSATAGNGKAAGFALEMGQWEGFVKYCYSAVSVTAGNPVNRIGFINIDNADRYTRNYWLQDTGFNIGVNSPNPDNQVMPITITNLKSLHQVDTTWDWVNNWTAASATGYPYPRIVGLDLYGDWPVGP